MSVIALGLHLLTARNNLGPGARRAIIEGDVGSSFVRMYQIRRIQSEADTRVFSKVDDAHRWLGLE